MGKLFDMIRRLVAQEKYVVGEHAAERLDERGIMEWQAVAGRDEAELIAERPDATANATVEVRECLSEGTEFKAVWSSLPQSGVVKLVTVHFFDRGQHAHSPRAGQTDAVDPDGKVCSCCRL